jgi:hypothetical protein
LLKSGELSIGAAPYIESQISALKAKSGDKTASASAKSPHDGGADAATSGAASANASLANTLQKIESEMDEVNARLSKIESQLGSASSK